MIHVRSERGKEPGFAGEQEPWKNIFAFPALHLSWVLPLHAKSTGEKFLLPGFSGTMCVCQFASKHNTECLGILCLDISLNFRSLFSNGTTWNISISQRRFLFEAFYLALLWGCLKLGCPVYFYFYNVLDNLKIPVSANDCSALSVVGGYKFIIAGKSIKRLKL